jgi:hypothetical protein
MEALVPAPLIVPNYRLHPLLLECCRQAEEANLVARSLDQLRIAIAETFHGHLIALAEEIRSTCRLLTDLATQSQLHISRVTILIDHLMVILPCLAKSLRDIMSYYNDKTLTKELRWRKMYNKMTEEAAGLPLPQRFILYNHFLTLLLQMLTRYGTWSKTVLMMKF